MEIIQRFKTPKVDIFSEHTTFLIETRPYIPNNDNANNTNNVNNVNINNTNSTNQNYNSNRDVVFPPTKKRRNN